MGDNSLTADQVYFAAKNHRLIYKYLKKRQLPKEDYYDVAVFGYIKAVRDYFIKEELKRYAFSTVCYRYMSREIFNYHKSLLRQKRAANYVCIHSGHELPIECRMPYGHNEMMKMESRLLFYDLARHISPEEMAIVKQYCAGESLREIARNNHMKIKQVHAVLRNANTVLKDLCDISKKEERTNEPGKTNRGNARQSHPPDSDRK